MGSGWVELLIYCGSVSECKGGGLEVLEQLRADWLELRGMKSFHGVSVADAHRQARVAGWCYVDGFWICPKCVDQAGRERIEEIERECLQQVRNP